MNTLTQQELQDMLMNPQEHFLFINVLPERQHALERIPGSLNIPVEDPDFIGRVREHVVSKNQKIVVYCAGFNCTASSQAAERLEEAGFLDVNDYRGGTKEWFHRHQKSA